MAQLASLDTCSKCGNQFMIVVCRNLRFLNNFPEISSKRSTSWNKFINVNTWSNATSANTLTTPDPLSLVTESQSLPLDPLMCV